jgi:CheY-like chemotaxis protein
VLVVDDDPDVRAFIAETLIDFGYEVRTADSGETGLSVFAAERPDLVVLDFIMPGLSGADVASRILKDNRDQPILFVSGYSETDAIRRIAPRAPVLAKPFRAGTLEKAVREALAGS